MTDWAPEDLDTIGEANEIQITTLRKDGSARPYKPIWVVRAGDALYVRSYRGVAGSWYRHAQQRPLGRIQVSGVEHDIRFADALHVTSGDIDRSYRQKYGSNGYVDTMVGPDASPTTMKLLPE